MARKLVPKTAPTTAFLLWLSEVFEVRWQDILEVGTQGIKVYVVCHIRIGAAAQLLRGYEWHEGEKREGAREGERF